MKKLFITLLLLIVMAGSSSALSYRGFIDGGVGYSGNAKDYGFFANTAHGIQINKIFCGLGAGVIFNYLSVLGYSMEGITSIPIFIKARYDFFNVHKANFFFSMNLGYNYGFENSINYFYYQPTLGVRIKTSSKCGFNIGFTIFNQKSEIIMNTYGLSFGLDF